MRSKHFRWMAGALSLLLAGTAGAAPKPDVGPESRFGEQVDVRVVNVEVVVTDKAGQRVPGLTASDFRLKVDGREVPVEYFSEVQGGQALAGGATAPVPGVPALRPGEPVGTSYLVFVDDYFSVAPRRNETLRSLKEGLTALGPEDRMAVVAFDGQRLAMLSSWSQDRSELRRAFDAAIGRPSHGLARLTELRSLQSSRRVSVDTGFGPRSFTTSSLDLDERSYANNLAKQLDRTVAAVSSTLRSFGSPPGRKVALLLSGGWPYDPVTYTANDIDRPFLSRDGIKYGEEILRPLVDTANRLGYTLYPIDVPGNDAQAVDAGVSAEFADTFVPRTDFYGALTSSVPQPRSVRATTASFDVRQQEVETTLLYAAEQTGGRALLNGRRIGALGAVTGDTRAYYWLGFTPTWKGNDERHNITVTVAHPGVKARFREDFLDLSRQSETSMRVESALLFGAPPDGGPRLLVELGKPVKTKRSVVEVPVTLAVPTSAITSVPVDGKQVAELELRVAAIDKRGDRSDIPVIPLRLEANKDLPDGRFARYETRLQLRNIDQRVVLAIFDTVSGKLVTAETDFHPGKV